MLRVAPRPEQPQDAQKVRPARPQRAKNRIVPGGYVEGLSEARTKLADFFSILLGVGVTKMPANPDLLLMLAQQLTPDDVTIFGDDTDQPIDILRMLAN